MLLHMLLLLNSFALITGNLLTFQNQLLGLVNGERTVENLGNFSASNSSIVCEKQVGCIGKCLLRTYTAADVGVAISTFAIITPTIVNITIIRGSSTRAEIEVSGYIYSGGEKIGTRGTCSGQRRSLIRAITSRKGHQFELGLNTTREDGSCIAIFVKVANTTNVVFDNLQIGLISMSAYGDPHITPLVDTRVSWGHARYVYTPRTHDPRPAAFNMITHPKFQLNSLWGPPHSVMRSFGVRIRDFKTNEEVRIHIGRKTEKAECHLVTLVNGVRVNTTTNLFPQNSDSQSFLVWRSGQVWIQTELVVLHVISHCMSLDFSIQVVSWQEMSTSHGILGQTARSTAPYRKETQAEIDHHKLHYVWGCVECWMEGDVDSYRTTDGIFGTNFEWNLF